MSRFAFVMFLTLSRAPLALLAAACSLANLAWPAWGWIAAMLALMSLSALTDLFDGKLSRKWGVTSRLGALADPLMDKVFYVVTLPTATFIALYSEDTAHAAALLALDVVSMARDLWVTFLRSATAGTAAKMGAGWAGKIRTALAFPVIVLVHAVLDVRYLQLREMCNLPWLAKLQPALYALEGVLLVVTVVSALSYTRYYLPYLKTAARKAP